MEPGRYTNDGLVAPPGIVAVEELDALEGRLAQEEALQLLRGGLLATGARFVDDPFAIDRAETKELQLRVASELAESGFPPRW